MNPAIVNLALVILVTMTGMLLMLAAIRMVPVGHKGVLFRMGKLQRELKPGTAWVMPFVDQVMLVNLAEQTIPLPSDMTLKAGDKEFKVDGTFTCKIIEPIPAVMAAMQAQKDLADVVGEYVLEELRRFGVLAAVERTEQASAKTIEALNKHMSKPWQVKFTKLELTLEPVAQFVEA
jgi:regulator of protease activity HflC (stomatin/prohibitin superfamily)